MSTKKAKYENEATSLMRSSDVAILSTLSKKQDEYPFGSFVTYGSGIDRSIYIYASDIAEHTRNIKNNPKSCLTIFKINNEFDKQNSPRLSIMGDLKKVSDSEVEYCSERFIKFLPDSKEYSKMHDFNFYKLDTTKVRWIGGFGQIGWLKNHNWLKKDLDWLGKEKSMLKHMNEGHSDSISAALWSLKGIKDDKSKILAICIDGYYVQSNEDIYFIQFEDISVTSAEIKDSLVIHAKMFKH